MIRRPGRPQTACRAGGGLFSRPLARDFEFTSGWHPAFAGNVFAAPFVTGATIGEQHDSQPQQQQQNCFSHATNLIGIVSGASLCH